MRSLGVCARKPAILAGAGMIGAVLFLLAAAEGAPEPKTTFEEVGNAIMSPVCPGKLLQDCPSGEGAQLRELVRRKISAGETKEQIVRYFVEVYGSEVLPKPPAEGFFLTAWLLPFAALAGGFGVVIVMVRAWTRRGKRSREERAAAAKGPAASRGGDPLEERLRRELEDFGR